MKNTNEEKTVEELFIIPCSKKKIDLNHKPLFSSFKQKSESRKLIDILDIPFRNNLVKARNEILQLSEYTKHISIYKESQKLPAYVYYKGGLYQKLENSWNCIKNNAIDFIIISGLYGVIFFDELIFPYNCPITETKSIWKKFELHKIVENAISKISPIRIFNHLSTNYDDITDLGSLDVKTIKPYFIKKNGEKLGSVSVYMHGNFINHYIQHKKFPKKLYEKYIVKLQ